LFCALVIYLVYPAPYVLVSFFFCYQSPLIPLQVIACPCLLSYLIKIMSATKKAEMATRQGKTLSAWEKEGRYRH
jgi:hypothetical protein